MKIVPRNKTGGVVTSTVMGVGALVIAVVIIFVVISTLTTSDLFETSRRGTTSNESTSWAVNGTEGAFFGNYTLPGATCTLVQVVNETNSVTLHADNYTQSNCTIVFSGSEGDASQYGNTTWIVDATTSYAGLADVTGRSMEGNMSSGIDNISKKIPTILLIVAVVFLFGALILLVRAAKQMGVGVGTGGGGGQSSL